MLRSIYTLLLPLAIGLTTLVWVAFRGQIATDQHLESYRESLKEISIQRDILRRLDATVSALVQQGIRSPNPEAGLAPPLDLAEQFAREFQLAMVDLPEIERLSNRSDALQEALELVVGARVNGEPQTILAAHDELFSAHAAWQRDLYRLDGEIPRTLPPHRSPLLLASLLALGLWGVLALSLGSLQGQLRRLPEARSWSYREIASAARRWQEALRGAASARGTLDEERVALQQERAKAQRLERSLAQVGLYNENLLNSLRSTVITTDLDFAIQSANLAARSAFGPDGLELGASALATELGQALLKDSPNLQEALAQEGAFRRSDLEVELLQGAKSHFDLRILSRKNEHNQPQGYLWMADDIGDAVEMKNALLRAEHLAAIGRLSAQVTHEIRNPLSAIGLNTEMLAEEIEEGTEAKDILDAISREIDRLSQITDSYLELARAPSPHLQSTDVHNLIRDLVAFMKPELSRDGVDVAIDPSAERALVNADGGQIRQALLNLLGNARDAMPQGGMIRLQTRNEGDEFQISIEDEGPGINAEVLNRVFEPFFSTKDEGTGLGLPLTRQIIEQHQGSIELRNREGGRGAEALVSLPLS